MTADLVAREVGAESWCIVAYYYEGGLEIFGPYESESIAGKARAELIAEPWCDNAIRVRMTAREVAA